MNIKKETIESRVRGNLAGKTVDTTAAATDLFKWVAVIGLSALAVIGCSDKAGNDNNLVVDADAGTESDVDEEIDASVDTEFDSDVEVDIVDATVDTEFDSDVDGDIVDATDTEFDSDGGQDVEVDIVDAGHDVELVDYTSVVSVNAVIADCEEDVRGCINGKLRINYVEGPESFEDPIAIYNVCLEEGGRVSLDYLSARRISNFWNPLGRLVVTYDGEESIFDGVQLRNDHSLNFSISPILREVGDCLEFRSYVTNIEEWFDYIQYTGLDPVFSAEHEGLVSVIGDESEAPAFVFHSEQELRGSREDYIGQTTLSRLDGGDIANYRFCSYPLPAEGALSDLEFRIEKDYSGEVPIDVFYSFTETKYGIPVEVREVVAGDDYVIPGEFLLYGGGCLNVNFSLLPENIPEALNQVQVVLTEGHATVPIAEFSNFDTEVGFPYEHNLVEIVQAPVVPRLVFGLSRYSTLAYNYIKNGACPEERECRLMSIFADILDWRDSSSSHIEIDGITLSIASDAIAGFDFYIVVKDSRQEVVVDGVFTINSGGTTEIRLDTNLVFNDLGEDQFSIVGSLVDHDGLDVSTQNFFEFGELNMTLTSVEGRFVDELTGEASDLNTFFSGNDGENNWGYNELPYDYLNFIVDESKLVAGAQTGYQRISISEYALNSRPVLMFRGSLDNLRGGVYAHYFGFSHNIDKAEVPGDSLEISLGGNTVVSDTWVQGEFVAFTYPEEGVAVYAGSSRDIEVSLINPDSSLAQEITPTQLSLTVIGASDFELEQSVMLVVSGFTGQLEPILLSEQPAAGELTSFME